MRFNARKMSSPRIDWKKTSFDVILAFIISDVIWGLNLSILEDEIFRTLERIKSNQPYYTSLVQTKLFYKQSNQPYYTTLVQTKFSKESNQPYYTTLVQTKLFYKQSYQPYYTTLVQTKLCYKQSNQPY